MYVTTMMNSHGDELICRHCDVAMLVVVGVMTVLAHRLRSSNILYVPIHPMISSACSFLIKGNYRLVFAWPNVEGHNRDSMSDTSYTSLIRNLWMPASLKWLEQRWALAASARDGSKAGGHRY